MNRWIGAIVLLLQSQLNDDITWKCPSILTSCSHLSLWACLTASCAGDIILIGIIIYPSALHFPCQSLNPSRWISARGYLLWIMQRELPHCDRYMKERVNNCNWNARIWILVEHYTTYQRQKWVELLAV